MARYGMLINTKKCVGCYACRVACQMVNGLESDEAFIKFDEMEQGVYPNVYAEAVPCCQPSSRVTTTLSPSMTTPAETDPASEGPMVLTT